MDEIETVIDCRYDKKCRYLGEDGKIHQCNAFLKVEGTNPNTGDKVDRWECSDVLIPLLLIENAMTNRGQTDAISQLTNETIKRQDAALIALMERREYVKAINTE